MTRQNRDLVMADNLPYVSAVDREVTPGMGRRPRRSFSRVFRKAWRWRFVRRRSAAIRPTGSSRSAATCPPSWKDSRSPRIPQALIGRGERDDWYTPQKFADDETRLRAAGTNVVMTTFDGGHEWTADFNRVAAAFLARLA